MTDTKALEVAMVRADVKKGDLAREIGISRTGLYNKMNNNGDFRVSEITIIWRILGLTADEIVSIFFAKQHELNS